VKSNIICPFGALDLPFTCFF